MTYPAVVWQVSHCVTHNSQEHNHNGVYDAKDAAIISFKSKTEGEVNCKSNTVIY